MHNQQLNSTPKSGENPPELLSFRGYVVTIRKLLFLLVLVPGMVHAYDFNDGTVDIPDGFEGPMIKHMGQGASSTAFTFPHEPVGGTLLQITSWNPGQTFPPMSEGELRADSEHYLLQFLGGIERKRENFKQGPVEFVHISGHPMAKVEWSGKAKGEDVHGVMYCIIFNSTIYSFHTQDFSSYDKKYTSLAVDAFESIELKR